MNLNALRYFYEASQYTSLIQASRYLHISQPALSKHIKNLEDEYGVSLVEKKGRYIQLTKFGESIIKESSLLFEQEKKIEKLLLNQSHTTPIKIGTTQLNSHSFIQHILSNNQIKDFQLDLITDNTRTICEKLLSEDIHLAILPKNDLLTSLKNEPLYSDYLIFVAKPDFCPDYISEKDIHQYQFIKREDGSYLQNTLTRWTKDEIHFSNQMTNHSDALLACVYGNGIYLCSILNAKEWIETGQLKKVIIGNFPNNKRDFYLYYSEQHPTHAIKTIGTKIVRAFIQEKIE